MLKPMQNAATLLTTPIVRSLNTLWHAAGLPAIGEGRQPLWQSICEGHRPATSSLDAADFGPQPVRHDLCQVCVKFRQQTGITAAPAKRMHYI